MNCTFNNIVDEFNCIVDTFIKDGFKLAKLSCVRFYPCAYNYRMLSKDNVSVIVSMNYRKSVKNDAYIFHTDIDVQTSIDGTIKDTSTVKSYYLLGDNYYTDNLQTVIDAKNLSTERYIAYYKHNTLNTHLNLSKLSSSVIAYLSSKINNAMDKMNRSHEYKISDIYFKYKDVSRKLVVVIKHKDNLGTEAIYFNP